MKGRITAIVCVLCVIGAIGAYTSLTVFVIQPIGAIPEGRTLVIPRTGKLNFVDSADGVCSREADGVSLLCRLAVLGAIAKADRIYLRLPYSETLYLVSTDGKTFER
jgi:hypothetical protein